MDLNLIAVNLLGLAGLRVFIRHQASIFIDFRFTVGDNGIAIRGFDRPGWMNSPPR